MFVRFCSFDPAVLMVATRFLCADNINTVTFVTHKPFAVLFFLPSCFVNSPLFKDIRPVEIQLKGVKKGRNPF